jgi:hypothetical protein
MFVSYRSKTVSPEQKVLKSTQVPTWSVAPTGTVTLNVRNSMKSLSYSATGNTAGGLGGGGVGGSGDGGGKLGGGEYENAYAEIPEHVSSTP